jgi:hypothetical protein
LVLLGRPKHLANITQKNLNLHKGIIDGIKIRTILLNT